MGYAENLRISVCCALIATPACALAAPQPPPRLADLVRVALVDRSLRIEWRDPSTQPPFQPLQTSAADGERWTIRAPQPIRGVAPGTLELRRPPTRTRQRDEYWFAFVSASPQRLFIGGHRGGRVAHETTLRFTQASDGAAQLVITDRLNNRTLQAHAADVVELRARHPQLVREHLVPILRQITGSNPLVPGATDVYTVFDELSYDEAVERSVRQILPKLGHPSFDEREHASRQLEALGPQAVCVVLRTDRETLMPEQRLRLANFLEARSHLSIDDPQALRRDAGFLIDCLEFTGDDRVRWSAKRELERLTGVAIPLHHAPTDEEWSNAANVLRRRMAAADER